MSKKAQLREQQERVQQGLRQDSSSGTLRLARLSALQQPDEEAAAGQGHAAAQTTNGNSQPPVAPVETRSRSRQPDVDAYLDAVCAYASPGSGPHCNLSIAVDPQLLNRLVDFEDAVERTYRRRVTRTGIVTAAIATIDTGSPPVAAQRAAPGTLQEKIVVRVSAEQRDRLRTLARSARPRIPVTILVSRALDSYLNRATKALALALGSDSSSGRPGGGARPSQGTPVTS